MAALLCNGAAVVSATIALPRVGAWTADLAVDSQAVPTGPVTITSADGTLTLVGTAARAGVFVDRLELRVVGGAHGLPTELPARFYRGVPVRLPLGDLLREAGETLAPSSDAALLARVLDGAWTRRKGKAGAALGDLLDRAGASWRVLPDGTVWVGTDAYPTAADFPYELLNSAPGLDVLDLGVESVRPELAPGTTFRGRHVSYVEWKVTSRGTTARVWLEDGAASPADRVKAPLEAIIAQVMRRVGYLGLFPARVVQQDADGTLHVVPDDDALPGMTGVPLRPFLPGATVTLASSVPPDTRVLVGFEGGDPSAPVAYLWNAATSALSSLVIASAGNATVTMGADGSVTFQSHGGAALVLTAGGDVHVLPGPGGKVMLGTTDPAQQAPIALGGDAVAGAAVTPVASRNVVGPLL